MTATQAVKTMRQIEVECPPLVARALPARFFKDLQLTNPPPIIFKKLPSDEMSGFCMPGEFVECNEIALHDFFSNTSRTVSQTRALRELADVYLHEISHRLAEGRGHDAVFATINLALLLRADDCYPLIFFNLSLYDLHEHFLPDAAVDATAALSFVIKNGESLAESNLTAEKIAIEAARRWAQYEADVLSLPARQAAQSAAAFHMKEQAQKIKWLFLGAGFLIGMTVVKLFG